MDWLTPKEGSGPISKIASVLKKATFCLNETLFHILIVKREKNKQNSMAAVQNAYMQGKDITRKFCLDLRFLGQRTLKTNEGRVSVNNKIPQSCVLTLILFNLYTASLPAKSSSK